MSGSGVWRMAIYTRNQLQVKSLVVEVQRCWRMAVVHVREGCMASVPHQGLQLRVWQLRGLTDDLP